MVYVCNPLWVATVLVDCPDFARLTDSSLNSVMYSRRMETLLFSECFTNALRRVC